MRRDAKKSKNEKDSSKMISGKKDDGQVVTASAVYCKFKASFKHLQ